MVAVSLIAAYAYWNDITRHIPKMRRYSLGIRIDDLFAEIIELISTAQFSLNHERPALLAKAINRNDVLKTMLAVLLELEGIEELHFIDLAQRVEEVGKMLYGWRNHAVAEMRRQRGTINE